MAAPWYETEQNQLKYKVKIMAAKCLHSNINTCASKPRTSIRAGHHQKGVQFSTL